MRITASTVLVVVLSIFFSQAQAEDKLGPADQFNAATEQSCESLKQSGVNGVALAKSGCCSWHQGVCGCSGGRQVCCDGSYSPSCTCNTDDPPEIVN